MRLVVATHNPKKGREMLEVLGARVPGLELLTLDDFPGAPEPEETGASYAENALLKVRSACACTGLWCVADDSGLEVDAMGGEPGMHSKRFMGEHTSFPEKMQGILTRLSGMPEPSRGARFRCCVALASPAGFTSADLPDWETEAQWTLHDGALVLETTCEGRIAFEPAGEHGFGYDPIFWLPSLSRTMAQLAPHEKHEVSHRGKALRSLGSMLARNRPS